MKRRTIIAAGSYLHLSTVILGTGIVIAAGLISLGNFIEGVCVCAASEREA